MKIDVSPNNTVRFELSLVEAQHLLMNIGDLSARCCGAKLRQLHKQLYATMKLKKALGPEAPHAG